MDCVILAAGRGTRLRPLTDTTPKPLVPVAGRGSLLWTLDALPSSVTHLILIIGYFGEQIRAACGESWNGIPITYIEQTDLNGSGGALRMAEKEIHSDTFLVLMGDDVYKKEDLEILAATPRSLLILSAPTHKPMDSWQLEKDHIKDLVVTQTGTVANMNIGAYHLGREWFDLPPVPVPGKTTEWSIPHALPELVKTTPYRALPATRWLPCGTPEELVTAENAFRS